MLENYIYLITIILWVALLVGVIIRNHLLIALAGMGIGFLGLFIINNGVAGNSNDLTDVFGIMNTFIGFTFFVVHGMEEVERMNI